jgi:integrase
MSRALHKLTSRTVETLTKPGRHSDGGGLYLVVDKSGAKRWAFIWRLDCRLKEMGLGGTLAVGLKDARLKADAARKLVGKGENPIAVRKAKRAVPTFGTMADAVIEDLSSGWRNPKHVDQWRMTLREYAKPIREKPVNEVTTDDIVAVLKPIWTDKPETAARFRGRLERVLDAAKAKGHRDGENPARWKGHLDHLLPRQQKVDRGHHAAMPYDRVPAFVTRLKLIEGMGAKALQFTILTAARTTEATNAVWSEFDLDAKIWTIPADRMKAGKEHRVPLSESALAIVKELHAARTSEYVFPGRKKDSPISNMTMDKVMRGEAPEFTVHGFRSSFRDWCAEETLTPREVAEAALAHAVGDATERAYRRGDALEKRRKLMDAWAAFIASTNIPAPPWRRRLKG